MRRCAVVNKFRGNLRSNDRSLSSVLTFQHRATGYGTPLGRWFYDSADAGKLAFVEPGTLTDYSFRSAEQVDRIFADHRASSTETDSINALRAFLESEHCNPDTLGADLTQLATAAAATLRSLRDDTAAERPSRPSDELACVSALNHFVSAALDHLGAVAMTHLGAEAAVASLPSSPSSSAGADTSTSAHTGLFGGTSSGFGGSTVTTGPDQREQVTYFPDANMNSVRDHSEILRTADDSFQPGWHAGHSLLLSVLQPLLVARAQATARLIVPRHIWLSSSASFYTLFQRFSGVELPGTAGVGALDADGRTMDGMPVPLGWEARAAAEAARPSAEQSSSILTDVHVAMLRGWVDSAKARHTTAELLFSNRRPLLERLATEEAFIADNATLRNRRQLLSFLDKVGAVHASVDASVRGLPLTQQADTTVRALQRLEFFLESEIVMLTASASAASAADAADEPSGVQAASADAPRSRSPPVGGLVATVVQCASVLEGDSNTSATLPTRHGRRVAAVGGARVADEPAAPPAAASGDDVRRTAEAATLDEVISAADTEVSSDSANRAAARTARSRRVRDGQSPKAAAEAVEAGAGFDEDGPVDSEGTPVAAAGALARAAAWRSSLLYPAASGAAPGADAVPELDEDVVLSMVTATAIEARGNVAPSAAKNAAARAARQLRSDAAGGELAAVAGRVRTVEAAVSRLVESIGERVEHLTCLAAAHPIVHAAVATRGTAAGGDDDPRFDGADAATAVSAAGELALALQPVHLALLPLQRALRGCAAALPADAELAKLDEMVSTKVLPTATLHECQDIQERLETAGRSIGQSMYNIGALRKVLPKAFAEVQVASAKVLAARPPTLAVLTVAKPATAHMTPSGEVVSTSGLDVFLGESAMSSGTGADGPAEPYDAQFEGLAGEDLFFKADDDTFLNQLASARTAVVGDAATSSSVPAASAVIDAAVDVLFGVRDLTHLEPKLEALLSDATVAFTQVNEEKSLTNHQIRGRALAYVIQRRQAWFKEVLAEPIDEDLAWLIYCRGKRGGIIMQYPELTLSEVEEKIREMWNDLSARERADYDAQALNKEQGLKKNLVSPYAVLARRSAEHAGQVQAMFRAYELALLRDDVPAMMAAEKQGESIQASVPKQLWDECRVTSARSGFEPQTAKYCFTRHKRNYFEAMEVKMPVSVLNTVVDQEWDALPVEEKLRFSEAAKRLQRQQTALFLLSLREEWRGSAELQKTAEVTAEHDAEVHTTMGDHVVEMQRLATTIDVTAPNAADPFAAPAVDGVAPTTSPVLAHYEALGIASPTVEYVRRFRRRAALDRAASLKRALDKNASSGAVDDDIVFAGVAADPLGPGGNDDLRRLWSVLVGGAQIDVNTNMTYGEDSEQVTKGAKVANKEILDVANEQRVRAGLAPLPITAADVVDTDTESAHALFMETTLRLGKHTATDDDIDADVLRMRQQLVQEGVLDPESSKLLTASSAASRRRDASKSEEVGSFNDRPVEDFLNPWSENFLVGGGSTDEQRRHTVGRMNTFLSIHLALIESIMGAATNPLSALATGTEATSEQWFELGLAIIKGLYKQATKQYQDSSMQYVVDCRPELLYRAHLMWRAKGDAFRAEVAIKAAVARSSDPYMQATMGFRLAQHLLTVERRSEGLQVLNDVSDYLEATMQKMIGRTGSLEMRADANEPLHVLLRVCDMEAAKALIAADLPEEALSILRRILVATSLHAMSSYPQIHTESALLTWKAYDALGAFRASAAAAQRVSETMEPEKDRLRRVRVPIAQESSVNAALRHHCDRMRAFRFHEAAAKSLTDVRCMNRKHDFRFYPDMILIPNLYVSSQQKFPNPRLAFRAIGREQYTPPQEFMFRFGGTVDTGVPRTDPDNIGLRMGGANALPSYSINDMQAKGGSVFL